MQNKLTEFKEREAKLIKKLQEKRLQLGEADGAMVSQFPSGRFELEDEIQVLQINLAQVKEEISKLEKRVF